MGEKRSSGVLVEKSDESSFSDSDPDPHPYIVPIGHDVNFDSDDSDNSNASDDRSDITFASSNPAIYPPEPFNILSAFPDLVARYLRLSQNLSKCRVLIAQLYKIANEDYPPRPRNTDGTDTRTPKTLSPLPRLLIEHCIRFKIWEEECGLGLPLHQASWLERLASESSPGHALRGLLGVTIVRLEIQATDLLEEITKRETEPEDLIWQAIILQRCDAISDGIHKLAELQPLVQTYRTLPSNGREAEGPLAILRQKIISIKQSLQPSIVMQKDRFVNSTATGWEYAISSTSVMTLVLSDIKFVLRHGTLFLSRWGHDVLFYREGLPLTMRNLQRAILQLCLFILHVTSFVTLPILLVYPVWMSILYLLAVRLVHTALCTRMNMETNLQIAPEHSYYVTSTAEYPINPSHRSERWILISGSGVSASRVRARLHWLSSNFGRPVIGLPTSTSGLLLDPIHDVVIRRAPHMVPITQDIRNSLDLILRAISDPKVTNVVLLAHGGGATSLGIIIDLLFKSQHRKNLHKVEVYTFGAFCTEFKCQNPPVGGDNRGNSGVSHIEHFSYEDDPVAQIGVLDQVNRSEIRGTIFRLPSSQHLTSSGASHLSAIFPVGHTDYQETGELSELVVREDGRVRSAEGPRKPLREVSRLYQYTSGRSPPSSESEVNQDSDISQASKATEKTVATGQTKPPSTATTKTTSDAGTGSGEPQSHGQQQSSGPRRRVTFDTPPPSASPAPTPR